MRLLDVTTSRLTEFHQDEIPPYAILSHTWTDDEISLQDIADLETARRRPGFQKIRYCRDQASADGLDYVWIDTCCIDKSSSAELQEAINSMYKWYAEATICYAYLADVTLSPLSAPDHAYLADVTFSPLSSSNHEDISKVPFHQSMWWTRGWTLQELIAPVEVHFYASDWWFIGSRSRLLTQVSNITKIDIPILNRSAALQSISVAKRMSWAAARQTTRVEDIAYCLLGIFDVSLPMLYGEGTRSFLRLQEEIIRTTSDHSIFAWRNRTDLTETGNLLATSPNDFAGCHNIVSWGKPGQYELTNRGLRAHMRLLFDTSRGSREWLAILQCREEDDLGGTLALRLQYNEANEMYGISTWSGLQSRAVPERLAYVPVLHIPLAGRATIEISLRMEEVRSTTKFWLRLSRHLSVDGEHCFPQMMWNSQKTIMVPEQGSQEAGLGTWFPNPTGKHIDMDANQALRTLTSPRGAVRLRLGQTSHCAMVRFGFDSMRTPSGIRVPFVDFYDGQKEDLARDTACQRVCNHFVGHCPHAREDLPFTCPVTTIAVYRMIDTGSVREQLRASIQQADIMGDTVFVVDVSLTWTASLAGGLELASTELTRAQVASRHFCTRLKQHDYELQDAARSQGQKLCRLKKPWSDAQKDNDDHLRGLALLFSHVLQMQMLQWQTSLDDALTDDLKLHWNEPIELEADIPSYARELQSTKT